MNRKFRVSEDQKAFIKFQLVYEQKNVHEIRSHPSMLKPDGTMHRLCTIRKWMNRFIATGNMNNKPKTGRPKKLEPDDVKKLLSVIEAYPRKRYPQIARISHQKKKVPLVSRQTVNRIARQNGYRK